MSTFAENIADALNAEPDFRVLRRIPMLDPSESSPTPGSLDGWTRCVVLDTETTGLDTTTCEPVELGMIALCVDPSKTRIHITHRVSMLEQPSAPLSDEVKRVTGLTDADLEGKSFDDDLVYRVAKDCDLFIAHNAAFDRPVFERRFPDLAGKAWACSAEEIDWKKHGAPSRALECVAWSQGWFYDAHRAVNDANALAFLLARDAGAPDETFMGHLLESSSTPTYRVWAMGSAFDSKDTLKARGYRWHDGSTGPAKCWYRDLKPGEAEEEVRFIRDEKLSPAPRITKIGAQDRYAGKLMHRRYVDECITRTRLPRMFA